MLRFVDGFDHYDTSSILRKWDESGFSPTITTAGRNGKGLLLPGSSWVTANLDSQPTWVIGLAIDLPADQFPGWATFLGLRDSGATQVELRIGPLGQIDVARAGASLATSSPVLELRQWKYIEFKATIGSAGSFEVRVNGATVLSGAGNTQATANAWANQLSLYGPGSLNNIFDDLYVLDNQPGLTDFLGDIKVVTIYPNANGTNNGWTPSAGTDRYATIDESPANDDTDYNAADVIDDVFTCGFEDIGLTGSIKGIQVVMCARKDDAGSPRTIAPVVRHGGVDYVGANQDLNDTYIYRRQVYETNPGTAAAWSVADLNAAEFGCKRIA